MQSETDKKEPPLGKTSTGQAIINSRIGLGSGAAEARLREKAILRQIWLAKNGYTTENKTDEK